MKISWWDDEKNYECIVRTYEVEIDGKSIYTIQDEAYNQALDDILEKIKPCSGCIVHKDCKELHREKCEQRIIFNHYNEFMDILDRLYR